MEGAPVFDKQGLLIGILTRPLRTKGGIAEIQVTAIYLGLFTFHFIKIQGTLLKSG